MYTDRQKDGQTDAGHSDLYVSIYFAGDTTIIQMYKAKINESTMTLSVSQAKMLQAYIVGQKSTRQLVLGAISPRPVLVSAKKPRTQKGGLTFSTHKISIWRVEFHFQIDQVYQQCIVWQRHQNVSWSRIWDNQPPTQDKCILYKWLYKVALSWNLKNRGTLATSVWPRTSKYWCSAVNKLFNNQNKLPTGPGLPVRQSRSKHQTRRTNVNLYIACFDCGFKDINNIRHIIYKIKHEDSWNLLILHFYKFIYKPRTSIEMVRYWESNWNNYNSKSFR